MSTESNSAYEFESEIDLGRFFSLFKHWAWLIFLTGAICGGAVFYFCRQMTPIYEASTTILVNEAPADKSSDYNSVLMSQKLADTYSEMMITTPILQMIIDQLKLDYSTEALKKMARVSPLRDTQLIVVTVENQDVFVAAAIANTIVEIFSDYIQGIQTERFVQSKQALENQIAETDAQIIKYEVEALNAQKLAEKESLTEKVSQYRTIYLTLQQSYEQIRLYEAQSVSSIVQIEPALPNEKPVRPKTTQYTAIAFLAGALLVTMFLFLREIMDASVKTPEEITALFGLPVLGVINHFKVKDGLAVTMSEPRSPTAEAYRMLRTQIRHSGTNNPVRKLLVTSSEPREGKSTIVCNLGIVMAQNGLNVVLIDCDLRVPILHKFFGLPNEFGFSTIFSVPNENPVNLLQATSIPSLKVLTSGPLPPNPSELIGSPHTQTALTTISQYADIIIIDSPPALAVTDATVLGSLVDGVLMVVRPNVTRKSTLRQATLQFQQVNANILGIVFNNLKLRGNPYAGHYHNYNNFSNYQKYYWKKKPESAGKSMEKLNMLN